MDQTQGQVGPSEAYIASKQARPQQFPHLIGTSSVYSRLSASTGWSASARRTGRSSPSAAVSMSAPAIAT
jgi:hypothetical protein